jgi:hypothetical protein
VVAVEIHVESQFEGSLKEQRESGVRRWYVVRSKRNDIQAFYEPYSTFTVIQRPRGTVSRRWYLKCNGPEQKEGVR